MFYIIPFSLFAARCMYVAKQPLSYRRAVIRRIYKHKFVSHVGLITYVKAPVIITSESNIFLQLS